MQYNKSLPKDRRRKVFERVVNPLLIKYLVSPWIEMDKHIAAFRKCDKEAA